MTSFFNEKLLKQISIDDIIISFFCCVPMLSYIINVDNIIPVSLSLLIIIAIYIHSKQILHFSFFFDWKVLYFIIFVLMIGLNLLIFGIKNEAIIRVLYFVVYGFFPFVLFYILYESKAKIHLLNIFKIINFIFCILALFIYFDNFWSYPISDRMPFSYYLLPLILSVFFEFYLDRDEIISKKIFKFFLYMIFFYPYIRFIIGFMSRGTIVAILFCILVTIISKLSLKKKIIVFCTLCIIAIVLILFGLEILSFLHNLMSNLGFYFEFIEKNIRLLTAHNLGNGRMEIYQNAINGIVKHPFMGNGIGSFSAQYGVYPHNFILQALYEGGFLYTIVICFPIFYSFIRVVFGNCMDRNFSYFYIFVFSLSIIRLFLSFEYWLDQFFWTCLFLSLVVIIKDIKTYKLKGELF